MIKILLIEDKLPEAMLVQEILDGDAQTQFKVVHTSRLSEGLERLSQDDIDVILLDLHLPDSQGLNTFTQMINAAPKLPIVVLSNLSDRAVAVESVRKGAQDYLVKGELSGDLLTRSIRYAIERKQIEETLRQRTKELAKRNEELDAFAHTVAHDLKNPLSLAMGFAEFLWENHQTVSSEDTKELAEKIIHFGRKVDTILDGLLVLTRVRESDVSIEPLDMSTIVKETLERLQWMIEEKEAQVIPPETWPEALGYASWIEEVWFNYISNALKYGGEHPKVELGAEVDRQTVRFWVRDDGPGISMEDQERIFTPFERLGKTQAKGHGLGLSIVQRIVTRLNGQAGVDSCPGEGSCFYFTLPKANG